MSTPSEELGALIASSFGLLEDLKTQFIKESLGVFGSGWCWLVVTPENTLKVVATKNQDNPLMKGSGCGGTPILGLDVWEHAYYLKYQNKRGDYLKNILDIINWEKVESRMV